ncbi:MAG: hypothetical protein IPM79_19090 [Polyangiaceae bacterium]|nr:hypothetical protein [Polyangiaceae bacterium]MBK8939662.1 hypothetical protein [Polyangiaceae bacterium]
MLDATCQAYADGRLSIDEVARRFVMGLADALVFLEEQGCRVAPAALRLTPEARAHLLSRIRAERIARGGEPRLERQLVLREVVASQRLEGIDARWVLRRRS